MAPFLVPYNHISAALLLTWSKLQITIENLLGISHYIGYDASLDVGTDIVTLVSLGIKKVVYFKTRSNVSPRTEPPPIAVLTLRANDCLLFFKSSAASLLSGSDAFGSKNKNYSTVSFDFQ